ncbi:DnaJ (Hsp40), sub C, member 11 [Aspergillus tubingensis]|uniref:DnaJ (Hsp40), sub C, member 11 n=1 Tax=Aspergillus tubingensis TaxID=5068 RepID=A0A9W6EJB1_ASPTU|nr:DnaJ (Hsp40), sub C, member 11 [Aspergillus tubingensis]GLA96078.1 DnaJ (Hsp40), sub C, member 11 [Aspergillus tubingensis]GLB21307.1 DnaJ (Hsp40), sub C, member 11 [Aspergillus tubingensis]
MGSNPPPPKDQDEASSPPEELDYYAILNLPRSPPPTEAQIRSAYRTLTLSFHPDKQPAELADSARRHFDRIQEAYDTLVDPKKRAVYDELGVQGMKQEWVILDRIAKDMRVGVRAMSGEEFRGWFLEVMKRRERAVVERMVGSRGSITIGFDASNAVSYDEEEDALYIEMPSPRPSNYALGFSFKAPLPRLGSFLGREGEDENENESENDEGPETRKLFKEYGEETELTFNAGISGEVEQMHQEANFKFPDGRKETHLLPLPYFLIANQINLGVGASQLFGGPYSVKGLAKPPFAFMQNSVMSVNASVLPHPSLETTWTKSFVPIPGAKPISVQVDVDFDRSPQRAPPRFALKVTRQIGDRRFLFGLNADTAMSVPTHPSFFQIGVVSQPKRQISPADVEEEMEGDEEDEEFEILRRQQRKEIGAAEAWQTNVTATPMQTTLSFVYSRNVFSGKSAYERLRSEWSSEGHHSLPEDNEPRSVRVNVETTVGRDLALGWHIEGTRQVGDFTRMGLGVGVRDMQGLVVTVSWSRLGQKIRVPISVIPFGLVDVDVAAMAIICPWLAYCALEFGFIRPREKKRHRRAIARRQKQLRRLVPKKRAESQEAIEIMTEQVQRRQAKEAKQGGLVILRAEYGYYPSKKDRENGRGLEVTDVSIPVAALVDHGQLAIPKEMAKSHILGFHDPAPLLPKMLKIWYNYHGQEHYVEAKETEDISCPMRSHLL